MMADAGDFDLGSFDSVIDPRSIGLEHWSYNIGMVRQVIAARSGRDTQVVVSPDCARLMQGMKLQVSQRAESAASGPRLPRLLAREWRAASLLGQALRRGDRVLLLHVHPLALCLAAPALLRHGKRVSVCLHNDFVGAARSGGAENRVEAALWRLSAFLGRSMSFVAPNRHFARFARQLLPRGTPVVTVAHPVLPRADYRQVAGRSAQREGPRFALGFFGRVDTGRGAAEFRTWVEQHPERRSVLAGRWTSRLAPLPNLETHDLPSTEDYCALLLRADALFLDLRDDAYRIGESGVYWDAVGTGAHLQCGVLPRLYRQRIRTRSIPPLDRSHSTEQV